MDSAAADRKLAKSLLVADRAAESYTDVVGTRSSEGPLCDYNEIWPL